MKNKKVKIRLNRIQGHLTAMDGDLAVLVREVKALVEKIDQLLKTEQDVKEAEFYPKEEGK